jgi:protein phosphatase
MLRVAEHFERTHTGMLRAANEDSFFARSPLFAVADGMGGAQAGEVASAIAVSVLDGGLPQTGGSVEQRLAGAVEDANGQIHERSRTEPELSGMGTTFTGVYLDEDDITVAHVGDSRAYRWRDGVLEPLTEDHSLVGEFIRQGKLTPEEAEEHPQRSIITRALGPEAHVQVDTHTWRAQPGDWYLLCSDGLTSMIPEAKVVEILTASADIHAAGRALVDAANAAGGRDNITVILFRVEEVPAAGTGADATRELQETSVGAAAPRTDDVRRAVAEHEERVREAEALRRQPRLPAAGAATAAKPKRRRLRRVLAALAVVFVLLAIVGVGSYFASQTVYFVGTDSNGFVTLYRGVPYELPFGVKLYVKNFTSGVNVDQLPAGRRKALLDQRLRSRDDAVDLVRQVEQGNITAK